ncbi:hypothetical protein, partial [Streptococcus thermophilus]
ATFLKEPIGTMKISYYIMSLDKTLYLAFLDTLGILMHKLAMLSKLSFLMFIRLECAVEQFFVVFRLDSVSCYVSYSNEWFNLLGRSVTNLLY